ncbi:nuclear transport factor 2 family protein [Roseibium sp. MMSF_3412]|uniref:nuclear transport factor 2 family protein n=1 Tax=Roseibium sp. MMSF_3412 TaxID=3046712 RepID=UPI00273E7D98|nr:nuclear transport factor 2 family protein [Roseibium sp. MMSF_3412]
MTTSEETGREVKAVIERLIENVAGNNTAILDEIYHDDMKVIMLSPGDEVSVSGKTEFQEMIRSALDANGGTIGTWARFHHVSVDGDTAHVLISRQNELTGPDMQITLGIDLVREQNRWRITREVIVSRPRSRAA